MAGRVALWRSWWPDAAPASAEGGREIWPLYIRSRWDFYRNAGTLAKLLQQDAAAQRALRDKLRAAGAEPLVVPVEPGDLVLLCAQRPHAVRPFFGSGDGDDGDDDAAAGGGSGARVSVQSFITHEQGRPLVLDA